MVGSYLTTQCGSESDAQPETATTTVESSAASATEATQEESPQPQQDFGEPGQFELPPTTDSKSEEEISAGEVRTIPPPALATGNNGA
jgi:hypothetical protein